MRFVLRKHRNSFELGTYSDGETDEAEQFRDAESAEVFLRGFRDDWSEMSQLRRIVATLGYPPAFNRLEDDDVIRILAAALAQGRIWILSGGTPAAPGPAPGPAPTPPPPSPEPRPKQGPKQKANCPSDFVITAKCRIIKAGGGKVDISAADKPGFPAGSFAWTTSSSKVKLTNASSSTVTVEGLANVSTGKDAETIEVTRTAPGCSPLKKVVKVTVAKVTFSASPNQRYGYDNFDTPANPLDDHICIKQSDFTVVKVDITGGAVGTDFDWVCDKPAVCTPVAPGGTASFDLRLNGGTTKKDHTTLHAKCKCPDATPFSNLEVHVYKERAVAVVVAKFDKTATGANLRFPTADYASHAPTANAKLKQGVVKYNITNYSATNAVTPVNLAAGGAVVSYDIKNGGGADLNALKAAMTGTGQKVRVAIIRDMKSLYFLSAAAARGATSLIVTAAANAVFYVPGDTAVVDTGANQETVTISAVAGSTITVSALTKAHASGASMEFAAGGWGSDPILIIEGSASLDIAKWTVLHEVGHRDKGLQLLDIIDQTDFMHFQQSWTDFRLRYCPRLKKYPAGTTGTENQWETIPRD